MIEYSITAKQIKENDLKQEQCNHNYEEDKNYITFYHGKRPVKLVCKKCWKVKYV